MVTALPGHSGLSCCVWELSNNFCDVYKDVTLAVTSSHTFVGRGRNVSPRKAATWKGNGLTGKPPILMVKSPESPQHDEQRRRRKLSGQKH